MGRSLGLGKWSKCHCFLQEEQKGGSKNLQGTSDPGDVMLWMIPKHMKEIKVFGSSEDWFTKWSLCLSYDEIMQVTWWRKGEQ